MKFIILCLCLSSTVSALPYYVEAMGRIGNLRQNRAMNLMGYGGAKTVPAPISMELVYPQVYPPLYPGGAAGGSVPGSTNPSQAYIKYSLPKAPGEKSVEIYYPFDFSQHRLPNFLKFPNAGSVMPFDYPTNPQMIAPQQPVNSPTFETSPPQLQDPVQPLQQVQPPQPTQVVGNP